MDVFKEPTLRDILESDDYQWEKQKIQNEMNWGAVNYLPERDKKGYVKEFKKSDEEKALLYSLKMQWRDKIKKLGYSKRKIPKTLYTNIH